MSPDVPSPSRPNFVAALGLSARGTAWPASAGAAEPPAVMPTDPSRATRANLGSLFPEVQKIAEANRYLDWPDVVSIAAPRSFDRQLAPGGSRRPEP